MRFVAIAAVLLAVVGGGESSSATVHSLLREVQQDLKAERLDDAHSKSQAALQISENLATLIASAQTHTFLAATGKAVEHLQKAVELREKEGSGGKGGEGLEDVGGVEPLWMLADMFNTVFGDVRESLRLYNSKPSWLLDENRIRSQDVRVTYYNMSMGVALHQARHGKYQEAMNYVSDALQVHPKSGLAQLIAGCLAQKGAKPKRPADAEITSQPVSKAAMENCEREWTDDMWYFHLVLVRLWSCNWEAKQEDIADMSRFLSTHTSEQISAYRGFFASTHGSRKFIVGEAPPLGMPAWGHPFDAKEMLLAAKVACVEIEKGARGAQPFPLPKWTGATRGKLLHVGYVSGDLFRQHPVGVLTRALGHLHDYSHIMPLFFATQHAQTQWAADPAMQTGPDWLGYARMIPIHDVSSEVAARRINNEGVHVLIDLSGYSAHHKQDVFALRPAPVLISHHGYLATLGCSFYNAFVGDRVVTPPELAPFFTEKIAMHPDFFLPSSHRWMSTFSGRGMISNTAPWENVEPFSNDDEIFKAARVANGLPAQAPVICYFNQQHHKLDPDTFQAWINVMKRVPKTVLWMHEGPFISKYHLAKRLTESGIERSRLVWTHSQPLPQHQKRLALCDLHLDSPMFNSGATGVDVLYAGVPIVTQAGDKVAGRMVSSMLMQGIVGRAKKLITVARNQKDLEEIVVRLLQNPRKLDKLRRSVRDGVQEGPMYDMQAWTLGWETVLRLLWDSHWSSLGARWHITAIRDGY